MYIFEATCAIQLRAQAAGTLADGELLEVDRSIIATAMEQQRGATRGAGPRELLWPGLLRKLDRIDPSYRN